MATPGVPVAVPSIEPLVEPLLDYGRGRGQSVTGGYVYRGTALGPAHAGRYFFGDFGSGRLWSVGLAVDPDTRQAAAVDEREHTDEVGGAVGGLASFARDSAGELYVVAYGGEIFRLGRVDDGRSRSTPSASGAVPYTDDGPSLAAAPRPPWKRSSSTPSSIPGIVSSAIPANAASCTATPGAAP